MSQTATDTKPGRNKAVIAGWVIAAPVIGMMLMRATMKVVGGEPVSESFAHLGWPIELAGILAAIELGCVIIYAVPQTAVLGAILLTGYLGGATATHVRIEEAWYTPVALGVLAWVSLWLRDPRVRAIALLRT